jgi:hypothetical protein
MPEVGEQIVIAADPADGGSDYCAGVAKSRKHMDSIMVYHERNTSSQFGYELLAMARFLKKRTGIWPLIAVERNLGMATIMVLQSANYERLFRMPKLGDVNDDSEVDKIGWVTNMQTRPMMLDDLSMALSQRSTKIYHEQTIIECQSFIRNPRTGKPEAAGTAHDDLVICEAIALQIIQLSPKDEVISGDVMSYIAQFPKQELYDRYGNPTS